VTGVQRHARCLLAALDDRLGSATDLTVRLLVPRDAGIDRPHFRHIEIVPVGEGGGHRWEQFSLPQASRDEVLLSLCNTGPLRHRRHVVTIHDASVFAVPTAYSFLFRSWYRWLLPRLGRSAAAVMTDSDFSKAELHARAGIPLEKLHTVHLGAEHIRGVAPVPLANIDVSEGAVPIVLLVASRSPHKNYERADRAMHSLPASLCRVVAVGGANTRVFRGQPTSLYADDGQLGYVSDGQLHWLYRHAAVLLYPSLYEGFGLPPLEAMACGCPVVASNAASLPEVCGDAARYVDPLDEAAMADAVRAILRNPAERQRLADLGRAHAARFSWQTAATRLESILRSVGGTT